MRAGRSSSSGKGTSSHTTPTVPAGSDVVGSFRLLSSDVAALRLVPLKVVTTLPSSASRTVSSVRSTGTGKALVSISS
jgi:hypothetical protein